MKRGYKCVLVQDQSLSNLGAEINDYLDAGWEFVQLVRAEDGPFRMVMRSVPIEISAEELLA